MPNYLTELSPDNNAHVYQIKDKEAAPIDLLKDTVGWVGKNLLPTTLAQLKTLNSGGTWSGNSYSRNNATFVCSFNDNGYLTDVEVSTSGNASADTYLNLIPDTSVSLFNSNKSYTLNGNVDDVVDLAYQDYLGSWGTKYNDSGEGVSFTPRASITKVTIYILVKNGTNISTAKNIKPMLRDASVTDSTFEPYHESVEQCKFDRAEQRVLGAKNLIDPSSLAYHGQTRTTNGITLTYIDGVVNINGTATANTDFAILSYANINSLRAVYGDMILNGCDNGSPSTYFMYLGVNNVNKFVHSENKEVLIDANATYTLNLQVKNGTTVNNVKLYPMLRLASDPDDTYAPYAMTNRELTELATVQDGTITIHSEATDKITLNSTSYISQKSGIASGFVRISITAQLTQGQRCLTLNIKPQKLTTLIAIDRNTNAMMPINITADGNVELFGSNIPTTGHDLIIPIQYITN